MPQPNKRNKPYRILRNLRVDEISAVDFGAAQDARIMLAKRDRDQRAAFRRSMEKIFELAPFSLEERPRKKRKVWGYAVPDMRKNDDVSVDPDGPINPGGDDSDATREERGFDGDVDRDDDVDDRDEDDREDDEDVFHAGDGDNPDYGEPTENLEELADQMEGTTMKSLIDIAKRSGWRTLCKHFVENGTGTFSEAEVTEMLTAVARKAHPDLKPEQAFAKLYSAQSPDGELMRRATMAARDAQFASRTASKAGSTFHAGGDGYFYGGGEPGRATLAPRVAGGADARAINNPRKALDQLKALADEQRRQNPTLSEAGAFARVYADPKNKDLAARERAENRPQSGW